METSEQSLAALREKAEEVRHLIALLPDDPGLQEAQTLLLQVEQVVEKRLGELEQSK